MNKNGNRRKSGWNSFDIVVVVCLAGLVGLFIVGLFGDNLSDGGWVNATTSLGAVSVPIDVETGTPSPTGLQSNMYVR